MGLGAVVPSGGAFGKKKKNLIEKKKISLILTRVEHTPEVGQFNLGTPCTNKIFTIISGKKIQIRNEKYKQKWHPSLRVHALLLV